MIESSVIKLILIIALNMCFVWVWVKKEYKIEGFKRLKSLNLLNSFKYRMALLEDINTGIELSE